MGDMFGHTDDLTDRRDGRTAPSQEHKPAGTPVTRNRGVYKGSVTDSPRKRGKTKRNGWNFSFLQTEGFIV